MKDTSQTERIKAYLLKGKTLTALDALQKFGCLRLASRIAELKDEYDITRERVTLKNGKSVVRYGISF